jgi:hypothetical protein
MEKTKVEFTIKALNNLKPKAAWSLIGDDWSGLQWDDLIQSKPTEAELDAETVRVQAEYASQNYQRLRAVEYPPMADYLDAVVKGDQEAIQEYIDVCLAVKAKYPKGV